MAARSQITLDPALESRAKQRAAAMGISFAEYVRRLIHRDLADVKPPQLEALFGIGDSGGSHVALHEDEYLNDAFADS